MTGWLAATGIAIVVLASLYTGLAGSGTAGEALTLATATPSVPEERATEAEEQEVDPAPEDNAEAEDAAQPEDGDESGESDVRSDRRDSTPTPVRPGNRLDCEKIRGTDYHSSEERTWYLSNCVRR